MIGLNAFDVSKKSVIVVPYHAGKAMSNYAFENLPLAFKQLDEVVWASLRVVWFIRFASVTHDGSATCQNDVLTSGLLLISEFGDH